MINQKDYSRLVSDAYVECHSKFAALASPTFSKQESVSFLYQTIEKKADPNDISVPLPWKDLMLFIPRLTWMFVRVMYAALYFKVYSIPENSILFRSWLVPRSFAKGRVVDEYFRELIDDVAQSERVIVSYTTVIPGLLRQFGRVNHDEKQIISYGFLSGMDVCRLFVDYLATAFIQVKKRYFIDGLDVTSYINRSLLLDYIGFRSFEAYAEKYKCNRLLDYNVKAFVYVYENQSWEKVCCDVLGRQGVRMIGYQSSGLSSTYLNFFPNSIDQQFFPMPERILTVGGLFRDYLMQNGVYSIPLEKFAALRFSYPVDKGKYIVSPFNQNIEKRVLYAFSVRIEQYMPIIEDLISVFGDGEVEVDLKLHPLYSMDDLKLSSRLPGNFHVVLNVDVGNINDRYDCVLFNDNSFGIEALINGVKSYQYNRNGRFEDDRFIYFDLWKTDYALDGLYELKDMICLAQYDKSFDLQKVSDYINWMYSPYTNETVHRFIEILNAD